MGTSSWSAHTFTESKKAKKAAKKTTKKDTSMTVIGEMQLSIHKRYLRTNTQNTIVVNSTQYESHIRRRYSNLEIYLLPLTDTVQLPVNGPCKSRYLADNVICTTVLSFNIQLYHCIPVFPRLYLYNTYLPNTDYTDYTDNRVVFII